MTTSNPSPIGTRVVFDRDWMQDFLGTRYEVVPNGDLELIRGGVIATVARGRYVYAELIWQ
jgi:hypothetical protein